MLKKAINIDDELHKLLEERYKSLFTKIILPTLLINGLFLFITHWDGDNQRTKIGMGVLLFLLIFNILLSIRNYLIKTPWGIIESRSDELNTLRWCINFPLDMVLFWSLDAHPAVIPSAWLMLTFGAMVDVYKKKNKLITMGIALISFYVFIIFIYPTDWKTQIYMMASFIGLVYILWKLERHVFEGMAVVFREKLRRECIEKEAQQLQREAAIGHSARHLGHELNNLIGIARLSMPALKNTNCKIEKSLDRLDRVHDYMSKISTLILDDLGNKQAPQRQLSLFELHDDVQLLFNSRAFLNSITIRFEFWQAEDAVYFKERTGSMTLIIHNLIKNAKEAIIKQFGNKKGGLIVVETCIVDHQLQIAIIDNGIGMSAEQWQAITAKKEWTTSSGGYGLGLPFVQNQCDKNNFKLTINSDGVGCTRFLVSGIDVF